MADTSKLRFTTSDEWVRLDGDVATIGITKHAEEELGDIALVQLPEVGRILQRDDKFGEVESIKAVSDLNTPLAGEVIEVNDQLVSAPEIVNADPYGSGWMIKIRTTTSSDFDNLLDETQYNAKIDS